MGLKPTSFFKNLDEEHVPHLLNETKNWYADRYHTVVIQRNILVLLTLTGLFCVLFSVYAVWQVTKSKTIEPFVIQVEKKTGLVTVVNSKTVEELEAKDALIRSYLMQYIQAREGYNPALIEYNYTQITRIMSSPQIWQNFNQKINSDTPDNPTKKYGSGPSSVRIVKLRSLIFTGPTSAQVRFTVQKDIGLDPKAENRIAVIEFKFALLAMNQEERIVNPLGFLVTGYRVDDEIL